MFLYWCGRIYVASSDYDRRGCWSSLCCADTLTLRSGRVITGQYLGGDARHIRMAIGDHVDTFDVDDVGDLRVRRKSPPVPPAAAGPRSRPPGIAAVPDETRASRNSNRLRPRRRWPASKFRSGHSITVRMIDAVDSNVARLGQTFRASVDEPVLVNGQTVIPRGADALVKLVEDKQSGQV